MVHLLAAVFLLSFSALAFEVLLARAFSISQWNHLAFMVISIALFGFAASGTFLKVMVARRSGWERRLCAPGPLHAIVLLYSASALLAFAALARLPLDYFRLPLEPIQTLYLLSAYLVLVVPFFFCGLSVSVAYANVPEKAGRVYLATMAGSACGALLPALLLPVVEESRLAAACALIPQVGAFFCLGPGRAPAPRPWRWWPLGGAGAVMLAALLLGAEGLLEVRPSPYKDLSQLLQFPDTRITARSSSIRGRVESVESPYIRFAPGQSLTFTGLPPPQRGLFTDGDGRLVLYRLEDPGDADFCRHSLPFAGYLLSAQTTSALIIAQSGGSAAACALAAGVPEITLLSADPARGRAIADHYRLRTVIANPRAFLARSKERYTLIQVDDWGPAVPGTAALDQGYLLTVEAFEAYLERLEPAGRIVVSRRLLLPPADSLRLWAAAYEALKRRGATAPERHLVVLRNWDTFTLIVSAQPPETLGIRQVEGFLQRMNFDLVYGPGFDSQAVNRFNRFDRPHHFEAIRGLAEAYAAGEAAAFFDAYPLDVAPQTDRRPFPHRFLKWSKLKEIHHGTGGRLYSLLLSGEVVVAVIFLEALAVSVLLLVLPLFALRDRGGRPPAAQVVYFFMLGAGFMFAELFFIKAYTLVFGNPVISFTAVVAGMLICSAVGGFWSERLGRKAIRPCLGLLVLILAACAVGLDALILRFLGWPDAVRQTGAILVLAPIGFLMGIPFALGMRYVALGAPQRAVAWTANGCASVLAAIAAAQVAVAAGIPMILVFGLTAYLAAWLAAGRATG